MTRLIGEFTRFCLVGMVNTAIDFSCFLLFLHLLGLQPLLANALAFVVALTGSFLMNKSWTFRDGNGHPLLHAYARFATFHFMGLVIGTLAILLLSPPLPVEMVKLLAVALTLAWNFSTSKFFVFNGR